MRDNRVVVFFLFVFLFVSLNGIFAASLPSIVGTWEYNGEDGYVEKYSFTSDGYYVNEINCEEYDDYYFGKYKFDGNQVDLEYCTYDVVLEKKSVSIDGTVFKRTANKVNNNTSKIAGVWENDYYMIGFTSKGMIISQGLYANIGDYKTENNKIVIDGQSYNYIIIGNNMYIDQFDFIDEYYTVKLTRKTSGGYNTFSKSILTNNDSWLFGSSDLYNPASTKLKFTSSGSFSGIRTYSSGITSNLSGTYTIDGSRIRLSNGDFVAIAIIDEVPIGYIIY